MLLVTSMNSVAGSFEGFGPGVSIDFNQRYLKLDTCELILGVSGM
jgi:hypothetical protein